MKLLLLCLVLGGLVGCTPEPPAPPPAPVKSDLQLKREKYFGVAAANDATVDWRSTGLGIKILVPGEGPAPKLADKVRVHYTGTLADGTVFDDTRAKEKPAVFPVSHLVRGLTEGLGHMKTGGRAIFYIPPSLGYGLMQAGVIPPLSGLIFEVELLEVLPGD
jgi:FKBP-type peptidyl-prolyl cis-trans isomerase